jgi:predicted transcriptional regulator
MDWVIEAAGLLKRAREFAGLSQRAMAMRAGTAQSVIARIESGQTDPGMRTLQRILHTAGYDLMIGLTPSVVVDSHMLGDVARILSLSPEERLTELRNIDRFVTSARRV